MSKSFGGLRAVDGVELAVRPGGRRALIGPNGAGKTTLFNLIAGALPVSSGRITLFGEDVTAMAQHRRAGRGLARTYQITNLFPALTVLQNVLLAAQARSPAKFAMLRPLSRFGELETRAREALAAVGLDDRAGVTVRHLSHGEQRQLEIALALAGRPRVLLLDEPAAGVPRDESAELFAAIAGLSSELTVLFIEHDMNVVFRFASRIIVMVGGRMLVEGTPDEISRDASVREVYLGKKSHALA